MSILAESITHMKTQSSSMKEQPTCYNCGKKGHIKPNCTEPSLCYGCKGRGHIRKDCPHVASNDNPAVRSNRLNSENLIYHPNSELVNRLTHPSLRSKVTIGDIDLDCILDTGAETSIIPSSVYHQRLKGNIGKLKSMPGWFMNVIGVGRVEVPIEGYIEVPIVVNGQTLKTECPFCMQFSEELVGTLRY